MSQEGSGVESSHWLFALVGCWASLRPTHPWHGAAAKPGHTKCSSLDVSFALAFEASAAGKGKGKRGSSGVSRGAALMAAPHPLAANPAGLLSAETGSCRKGDS